METLPEMIQVLTLTLSLLKVVGVPGIISLMVLYPAVIIFLWITHERQVRKILSEYGKDMSDMRSMYEKNVSLVKDYEGVAGRFEKLTEEVLDVVKANTHAMTRLDERLKGRLGK